MANALSAYRQPLGLALGLTVAWIGSALLARRPPEAARAAQAAASEPAATAATAPAGARPRKPGAYTVAPVEGGGTLRITCRLARPLEAQALAVPLNKDKGPGKCGHETLPNDRALVDPATLGLANCVVYLPDITQGKDFEGDLAQADRVVTVDQQGCQYHPHVALVRAGARVSVKNSDPVQHNVKGFLNNKAQPRFNIMSSSHSLLPPSDDTVLDKPGTYLLYCDIHLWMTGYLRAVAHPYHALTAADGTAVLANVPPGPVKVACWHEGMRLIVESSGAEVTGYRPSPDFDEAPQTVTVPSGGTVDVTFLIEPR